MEVMKWAEPYSDLRILKHSDVKGPPMGDSASAQAATGERDMRCRALQSTKIRVHQAADGVWKRRIPDAPQLIYYAPIVD